MEAKKSIKEKSITCLVCGKTMKVITKKHLALHGLDAVSYRDKFGLKKGTPLTCKELQRARRKKMSEMKLWERCAEKRKIDFGSVEERIKFYGHNLLILHCFLYKKPSFIFAIRHYQGQQSEFSAHGYGNNKSLHGVSGAWREA